MKNINKLTKAELISQIKGLKQNNESKDSILSNIMTTLLLFKSFILKITLIALIIKIFKKYSIFRKIFTLINTILFSIFGFSMIDIYEIEFLSKFFNNLIDIFSKFHSNILELFGKKVETPIMNPSNSMRGIQPETTGIQTNNDESNRIIERFKKIVNKEEVKPEIIQEDNPYYKNKYVIIGGLLVLSGITWYFYDDLKPIGSSILAWINISRSWSNDTSDDSNGSIQRNIPNNNKSNLQSLKDWLSNKFSKKPKDDGEDGYKSPDSSIKLGESSKNIEMDQYFPELEKGKTVSEGEISKEELERREIVNQPTGFSEITGKPEVFWQEGEMLKREMETFTDHFENEKFPRSDLTTASYNIISRRVEKWMEANPELFKSFMEYKHNEKLWDDFRELHADINLFASPPSETYEEAEIAANREKDIWSDRGNSPQQPLSPELFADTAMDTVDNNRSIPQLIINDIEKAVENLDKVKEEPITPSDKLKSFWNDLKEKVWDDKAKTYLPLTIESEDILDPNLLDDPSPLNLEARKLLEILLPESKEHSIKDDSSPSEMGEYFTEKGKNKEEPIDNIASTSKIVEDQPKPPAGFISLFEQINQRRKEVETSVSDNTKLIVNNSTIDENPDNKAVLYSKENLDNQIKNNPDLAQNIKKIKSQRLEYGSPKVANVGLPRGDLSPLIINKDSSSNLPDVNEGIDLDSSDNTNNQKEEELPLHNWKEEVKLKINRGHPYERFIDFDFGNHIKDIQSLYVITNDGESYSINPNVVSNHANKNSFKWDIKGTTNPNWKNLDICSITLIDKSQNSVNIYDNLNVKFLANFKDNIGKGFK